MKAIGKLVLGALMLAGTAVAAAPSAEAAWYGGYSGGYGPGWGRPGTQFNFGVGPAWTTGRWVHGWHGPRYGWWWTVGNSWYGYPRPVYPYPSYGPPPVADADGYALENRSYAGGYDAGADRNPQRPEYWYFCRNPEGYYPYVQDCDDWQQELAQGGPPPGDYPEYEDQDFQREQ
jgi:hypothetical protein